MNVAIFWGEVLSFLRSWPSAFLSYVWQPLNWKGWGNLHYSITIQEPKTKLPHFYPYAGHCWRSKDELISDVLLWTPTYDRAKAGRPARTYIQQLCEDTGCNPEDLPKAMSDREKWRERVRDIRAGGMTWWWWWWCMYYSVLLNRSQE